MLSLIQNGHTSMNIIDSIAKVDKTSRNEISVFPIIYDWFEDKLRVSACNAEIKDIIGYELIAINDVPIDEIINIFSRGTVCYRF